MKILRVLLAIAFAALALPCQARSPVAGTVFRVQGSAIATDEGGERALVRRAEVRVGDRIRTAASARLGFRLVDGTTIELGENTEFTVQALSYREKAEGSHAVLELGKGVFRAVTGKLMKAPDARLEVKTPVATIGVRGTDFWGGFLFSDALDVVMLDGKGVYVETAAGRVELDRPGLGTTVATGEAPAPAAPWAPEKLARAKASVSWGR